VLPKAALVPILMFVAVDIVEQSFHAVPRKHAMAVTFAMFPNIAQFALILLSQANFLFLTVPSNPAVEIPGVNPEFVGQAGVFVMLAHGFILTGMLWGGALAFLADRRAGPAVATLLVCAAFAAFGVIHSVDPDGGVYLPWAAPSTLGLEWAAGYVVVALSVALLSMTPEFREPADAHH
jgi:AGZA family xanthine/uracil permease-like MFS transporter